MATTKYLFTEKGIRWIQMFVNAAAFVYLILTWAINKDKKTTAQGDIVTVLSTSPPRRRYTKPKSLRQIEVVHRASR